ncbi:protein tumorous imaginal discs, mitochondrial-like [Pecten maximus]|uniref:protein tumorous imaginal discs, mitochondrial-like n=1 Tax=Pecten maximus TaxID=6579 RepID=UPI0014590D1D|nr:protein tumorous imaginal discs, mitochondrial-like [Pecten maximus]XP_033736006.1 protein tumorous imaginal discs, mitochondrial-like [Pecten maximus]
MSLTAAVCGCVTRTTIRWHHPKIYSWPAVLIVRYSHYDVLGVPSNATQKDIKAAFIDKSKKYHPDRNSDPNAKKMFAKCAEAYEILGKEKLRSEYDATLRGTSNHSWQSAGAAPDPFQSATGFNPRQKSRPRGSYSNRTGYDSFGWNPYASYEDVYFRKGRHREKQYWKKDYDKKSKSIDPREAEKREKRMWRYIGIILGVFVTMQFLVESSRATKRIKRHREIEKRIKEREFLAKLKKSDEK